MVLEFVSENELNFLIGLGLSLFAGFLIGVEREIKHKPTGIGTITLVVAGAMIFTHLSNIVDPNSTSRIAASIVTGIGFLGAGAIIASKGEVHGLTTAASLWAVAAIGLAVGVGFYAAAIITAILIFLVLELWRFEYQTGLKHPKSKD